MNDEETGTQKLAVLLQGLQGEHIPWNEDRPPFPTKNRIVEIDCCDVPSGDCNSGSCVDEDD